MVLTLAKTIDNLSSPNLFNLSQETSGQQSPLSVYAYAISITLCQPCVRLLLLQACKTTDGYFSLPPSTIPVRYLCDRCIEPIFHSCQSLTLPNCFGQVMHILGNKIALIFPLWTSISPSPLFRPWTLA